MGADFIEKAAPSFKKSWDRERVALATANLFTNQPTSLIRTVPADIVGGASLKAGELLVVEADGGGLAARRGNVIVARIDACRPELMAAVEASCGIAKGFVEQVHDLAGTVEISLC
jgi:hypothetical protein